MEHTSLETEQDVSISQQAMPPTAYGRADLHMHTNLGDGWASPAKVIEVAIARGLNLIAVTDHDHIEGAKRVADLLAQGDYPLRLITGVEVSTRQGHLLGLFVKKAPKHLRSVEESIDAIKEQGGLVYLEHPYDTSRRNLQEKAIERIAGQIDIVEVVNGRSGVEVNRRAEELRSTLGVPGGAGSDAHTIREIGSVYVEMEAFDGAHDFLVKLRSGRIVTHTNRWLMAAKRRLAHRSPKSGS